MFGSPHVTSSSEFAKRKFGKMQNREENTMMTMMAVVVVVMMQDGLIGV